MTSVLSMDKADQDFLTHLFKENNQLRSHITNLTRQLHNTVTALEETSIEIKHLKQQENGKHETKTVEKPKQEKVQQKEMAGDNRFLLEKQELEITQLSEELLKVRNDYQKESERNVQITRENEQLRDEMEGLKRYKEQIEQDRDALLQAQKEKEPDLGYEELARLVQVAQQQVSEYKQRMMDFANESNALQNAQQNQLQGVQALIEGIRDEYEEFITITKIENESFQQRQKQEFQNLKSDFEKHKLESFEEKKRTMMEYQNILSSMQAQFDEYRTTTEFLFNVEMIKLEEEISSQASRYEQEIMYVIQAKDKFYMDMMVTKDAKIMGLIEGSDLQAIMQKHELDMENLRKEHARDVERVKSEHESESKNVMLLLQRQNVSLESKTEKLQTHLKSMEMRMKELMNTIDAKNKMIQEKDEQRQKLEQDYLKKLSDEGERIQKLVLEKERLRHKVIRLNLNAKGEGENSIDNMLKRLSNDTSTLKVEFEQMSTKYNSILGENQDLVKKLREKEKMVLFMERELERRTKEYREMTHTFEEFLAGRAKQAKKDRMEKLKVLSDQKKEKDSGLNMNIVKATVPDRVTKVSDSQSKTIAMLDRGYVYLKRFKNLSKAFQTGDFRTVPNIEIKQDVPGPWTKTPLYNKLQDNKLLSLYKEQPYILPTSKPAVYHSHQQQLPGLRVYQESNGFQEKVSTGSLEIDGNPVE